MLFSVRPADALCFQLQLPLEPFVVDKFINETEDGNAVYTQLQVGGW